LITSFNCKETAALFDGKVSRKVATNCSRVAQRKLQMLHAATNLEDLKAPPGNRLEALKKDRQGQHSVRVNEKWRVCSVWDAKTGNASEVEIVDYH
jgi:proteic killer suppression protein